MLDGEQLSRKQKRILSIVGICIVLLVGLAVLVPSGGTERKLLDEKSPDGKFEAAATAYDPGGLLEGSYYYVTIYAMPRRNPFLNVWGGLGGSAHKIVWTASEGDQVKVKWTDDTHLSISCLACANAQVKCSTWHGLAVSYINKPL